MRRNSLMEAICGGRFAGLPLGIALAFGGAVAEAQGTQEDIPQHRAYGAWRSSSFGSGGCLPQAVFAPSDPKRMYLIGDLGGCWRSDDAGKTWHMLHGALPSWEFSKSMFDILVDPNDADKLFLSGQYGVWSSGDGGKSFKRSLAGDYTGCWMVSNLEGKRLAFDPKNSNIVYACLPKDGLFKSLDGGRSWTHGGLNGVWPTCLCVDRANGARIWLSSIAPKDKASFGGASFQFENGLFLSEDGGASWEKLSDATPKRIVQMNDPQGSLIGLFGDARQVCKSSDGGTTWEPFSSGLAPFPATHDGMYRTDGVYYSIAVASDGSIALGGCGGNYYKLNKGENSWSKVFDRTKDAEKTDYGGDWWTFSPKHPGNVWGNIFGCYLCGLSLDPKNPDRWAATDWYALYLSNDGGKSWKLSIDGVEMLCMKSVMRDVADPSVVYACAEDVGYIRSSDGGLSFCRPAKGGVPAYAKSLAHGADNPNRIYATGPKDFARLCNQIYLSEDKGMTWRKPAMKDFPDQSKYRCDTVAVDPSDCNTIFTAVSGGETGKGMGGVWRSLDAGENWEWMGEGLPASCRFETPSNCSRPNIAASADGTLVVASSAGLFRYSPGSKSWSEVKFSTPLSVEVAGLSEMRGIEPLMGQPGHVNDIAADPKTPGRYWIAKSQAGLWRSDDGGKTWLRVSDHEAWSVAVDFDNPELVVFGDGKGFHFSSDGGEAWRSLGKELPARSFIDTVDVGKGRLFVATHGNGVFWTDVKDCSAPAERHGSRILEPGGGSLR